MITQNKLHTFTSKTMLLLIGIASVVGFASNRGGIWAFIIGVTLLLILHMYREEICETSQDRWIYSALWAMNFLTALTPFLPTITTLFGFLDSFIIRTPGGYFHPIDAIFLLLWLVLLLLCKAYIDWKAKASASSETSAQISTTQR